MDEAERPSNSDPNDGSDAEERYRLDPAKFPRRIDLELSEPLLSHLEQMAARRGSSINDLITEMLSRQLDQPL